MGAIRPEIAPGVAWWFPAQSSAIQLRMAGPHEAPTPPRSSEAEQVFLAWLDRTEGEERGDLEALCSEHVEIAEELRCLAVHYDRALTTLARLTGSARDSERNADSPDPLERRGGNPHYEIRGEIARGGMGVILEVYDPSLRRSLAMKRLDGPAGDGLLERLQRERRKSRLLAEAQILGQLDHPGVVPVHEVGVDEAGELYFTMQRVRGRDFGSIITAVHAQDREWPLARALGVLSRVCEAVAYAHAKGVVHRDLKPANVMVGRFGETYVMDWGLARTNARVEARDVRLRRTEIHCERVEHPGAEGAPAASPSLVRTSRAEESDSESGSALLTLEGDVVGTPAYMPPEQAQGRVEAVGDKADVYALGAMLYHLLAGRRPYSSAAGESSAQDTLAAVLKGPPESVRRLARDAPEELVAITEKAMARDVLERYASMSSLAGDLRAYLEGRVVRAHRTGPVPELLKWIKRNKGAAAAIAVTALALVAVAVVEAALNRKVGLAREIADARAEALRRENYFNQMALAASAYADGDTLRLQELLEGCPEDLRGWEWRHLTRESDSSDLVLSPGSDEVDATVFTPDGCAVLTSSGGANSNRIVAWDARTGALVREISPAEQIGLPTFSHDTRALASMSRHGELRLWDAESWQPIPSLIVGVPDDWPAACFAPCNPWLAAFGPGPIEVWDTESRQRIALLDAGQDHVGVCWSPDASRLYAGAWDGSVSVWDLPGGNFVALVREHSDRIEALAASPDGRWLATGGWEGRVLVWDTQTLEVAHRSDALNSFVKSLAWSPDASLLAVASGDVVRVLETASWTERARLVGHVLDVNCVAFDREGRSIVTGSLDGTARVWDLDRSDRWKSLGLTGAQPGSMCFSRDGRWLLMSWAKQGRIDLWSVPERRVVHSLEFGQRLGAIDLSPDASRLVLGFIGSQGLSILDPWTRQTLGEIASGINSDGAFFGPGPSFSPDGTRLSVVGQDGSLSVWNASTCQRIWQVTACGGPPQWPYRVAGGNWSPDGAQLVTATADGRVQIWNAVTGALVREARGQAARYLSATFSADGRGLLLSSRSPSVFEGWDAESMTSSWTACFEPARNLLPSLDGARILAIQSGGALKILDAHSGRLIASLPTDGYVWPNLAVSPLGDIVATASNRGVRFWDTRPWQEHSRE